MKYIWQQKIWPDLFWDSERLIEAVGKVRLAQGKLLSRMRELGMQDSRQAHAFIIAEETIKTAEIEGEKLSPLSVRSSIAKQLGLPMAGLPPIERPIDGLVGVILDATVHHDKPLTLQRIKGWQAALFPTGYSGMHPIRVGRWRTLDPMQVVSGPLGREKVHFEAPPSSRVDSEMRLFLKWWQESLGAIEGLLRAGLAHLRFVTIHPFEDGNGRVARALTEMALSQDEGLMQRYYSLSAQIMADRKSYYAVLENSTKGNGDVTEWLEWFIKSLELALKRSDKLLHKIRQKTEFWHQHTQTSLTERQRKVINKLLDAGVDGFTGGLTTRKYVAITKTSRATAFREINDLVAKKILVPNTQGGRSTSYTLIISRIFDSMVN